MLKRIALHRVSVPGLSRAERVIERMGTTGRTLLSFFVVLIVGSSLYLAYSLNEALLIDTPQPGGSLTEGIVGSPRFVNPLLAISEADRDLTALVYSGLLRATPEGTLVPDLAEHYALSEDGRTYTFVLRSDAVFHNGTPVTADDVVFTVTKAQDPGLKSPKRANWDGVTVEKLDALTVRFTLREPYAPFVENATLGILPHELWRSVSSDEFPFSSLNTEPIGSGPYEVASIDRSSSGIPSRYTLRPFASYVLGRPYLAKLTLAFFDSEKALVEALRKGDVEAANSISPESLTELQDFSMQRAPLNRVFGVFFNQNQSEVLREYSVRHALNLATNRERLVADVLDGYGTPLDGPVPPGILSRFTDGSVAGTSTDPTLGARTYLEGKGWEWSDEDGALILEDTKKKTKQVLAFDLATANVPELRAAAEFLRDEWTRMGAKVTVKIFEQGDLNQNVIRPRKYDALLFGEVVGRELDLFAFWHSSQRNDPGLNIALYANSNADRMLENLRKAADTRTKYEYYLKFKEELDDDIPAIFLYTPDFVYITPPSIHGITLGSIATPAERFLTIPTWYTDVDHVWSFFAH